MTEYKIKPKEESREKAVLLLLKPSVNKKLDALVSEGEIKSKNDLLNFLATTYLDGEMQGISRINEESESRTERVMVYFQASTKQALADLKKANKIRSVNDLMNALIDEWLKKRNY